MVKGYKNAGYSTIFVTDHFQPNTIDSYGYLPREDKMTLFLCGYYSKTGGREDGRYGAARSGDALSRVGTPVNVTGTKERYKTQNKLTKSGRKNGNHRRTRTHIPQKDSR